VGDYLHPRPVKDHVGTRNILGAVWMILPIYESLLADEPNFYERPGNAFHDL
jgi:hypothetical protein